MTNGHPQTERHIVRLDKEISAVVRTIAENRRVGISTLIRSIVLEWLAQKSYLDAEIKKAVGVR